jgi:prophage maintenance system killer protein
MHSIKISSKVDEATPGMTSRRSPPRRTRTSPACSQTGHYTDLAEMTAALFESLITNTPFVDGNKRVAFFATDVFLLLNRYWLKVDAHGAYRFLIRLLETIAVILTNYYRGIVRTHWKHSELPQARRLGLRKQGQKGLAPLAG